MGRFDAGKRKRDRGFTVYTEKGLSYYCPDRELKRVPAGALLVPTRGFSANLSVFTKSHRCIGWIDTRSLGYENVKAWMKDHPEWKGQSF
jgi:hypothetical protein